MRSIVTAAPAHFAHGRSLCEMQRPSEATVPKLPPAEPSWLSPVLPWLILAFAVVTFVLGFSRGPLHGTKVYGRRGWFVFTVGIFFALLIPGLVFVAILEQDLVRLRHRMFADCSSPLVLSRVLLSRRPHRTAPRKKTYS